MDVKKTECPHKTVSSAVEEGCSPCLRRKMADSAVDGMNCLGWRPIHVAAHLNHVQCLEILIVEGKSDVNWQSHEGQTPLMVASREGHLSICEVLIKHNAYVNILDKFSQNALMYAVQNGRYETAKLLCRAGTCLESQDYAYKTPLLLASGVIDIDMIKILLEAGADVNHSTYYGYNLLMFSLARVHFDETTNVINEKRRHLNDQDFEKLVDLLKDHCSESEFETLINNLSSLHYENDKRGRMVRKSPASLAAKLQSSGPLKKLLQVGADVNTNEDGSLPLLWSLKGCTENYRLLLPPVTDLLTVVKSTVRVDPPEDLAFKTSSDMYSNVSFLVAVAISDNEGWHTVGERLRLALQTELKSVINLCENCPSERRMDAYFPRPIFWESTDEESPPSVSSLFGCQVTPLTRMIMEGVDVKNVEIMVKNGATWDSKNAFKRTIPLHFFLRDPNMIETIGRSSLSLNLYHERFTFNLTILTLFMYPKRLRMALELGVECRSCFFFPVRNESPYFYWTFEKWIKWYFSDNSRRFRLSIFDFRPWTKPFSSANLCASFTILLEYCRGPFPSSVYGWVCDLLKNPEDVCKIVKLMDRFPELKTLCRREIRCRLASRISPNQFENVVKTLGLPRVLQKFLVFKK